jgi:HAD superfamily hydrolase (TIGR01509 family)
VAVEAALLDVDGTLIDANYQHALAWYRAFREHDIVLPVWRIHRAIGMGGDQLVPALVGERADEERGDEIRETRDAIYKSEFIHEIAPLEGAHDLIAELRRGGIRVVLASSSPGDEIERYLDLLEARELADAWTTKDDVDATKPAPDLIVAALEKAQTTNAVMVGDTPWDIEAARKADVDTICVITGGWSKQELLDAGAAAVYESVAELRPHLGEPPFA